MASELANIKLELTRMNQQLQTLLTSGLANPENARLPFPVELPAETGRQFENVIELLEEEANLKIMVSLVCDQVFL